VHRHLAFLVARGDRHWLYPCSHLAKVMGGVVGEAMGEVARTDARLLERITAAAG